MVVYKFNPNTREGQVDLCEFEASLVYRASSRTAKNQKQRRRRRTTTTTKPQNPKQKSKQNKKNHKIKILKLYVALKYRFLNSYLSLLDYKVTLSLSAFCMWSQVAPSAALDRHYSRFELVRS